jgi:hypothetical protein
MKNLESSQWFAEPNLVVIRTVERDKRRQSEFSLRVKNLTVAKLVEANTGEKTESAGGADGGSR